MMADETSAADVATTGKKRIPVGPRLVNKLRYPKLARCRCRVDILHRKPVARVAVQRCDVVGSIHALGEDFPYISDTAP